MPAVELNERIVTWNYRVLATTRPDGEYLYAVHEVYYDEAGRPTAWTKEAIRLSGDSIEDIAADMRLIESAFTEPPLLQEDMLVDLVRRHQAGENMQHPSGPVVDA